MLRTHNVNYGAYDYSCIHYLEKSLVLVVAARMSIRYL
jgi:hypothetical protein